VTTLEDHWGTITIEKHYSLTPPVVLFSIITRKQPETQTANCSPPALPRLFPLSNCYLSTFTIMADERKIAEHMLTNELKEVSKENLVNAEVGLRFLFVPFCISSFVTGSIRNH